VSLAGRMRCLRCSALRRTFAPEACCVDKANTFVIVRGAHAPAVVDRVGAAPLHAMRLCWLVVRLHGITKLVNVVACLLPCSVVSHATLHHAPQHGRSRKRSNLCQAA
jgi:hypothetical protein